MITATGHTLININKSYNSIEFWDRLLMVCSNGLVDTTKSFSPSVWTVLWLTTFT